MTTGPNPTERTTAGPAVNPADRAVRFISNLTLTDDYDGQPFRLRPWQERRIIRPIFGTLRPDGRRRYRRVFLFLPRKQAKTQTAAAVGMYGLKGQGKAGESVICAAASVDQASHLFSKCERMIEADPWLSRFMRIYRSDRIIEDRNTDNQLRVVSSDGRNQHGLNPSILLFDELHTQKNRELCDALTSGFQTRKEPLAMLITTAGNDLDSLCHEEYEYACRVRDNPSIDPAYLPIIYEADPTDDIWDERTWHKAMPALGDFCELDFIRSEFARAREIPSEEAKCRQFYLNLWTPKATRWLPVEAWDDCGRVEVGPDDFDGVAVHGGIDLASTKDTAAFVFVSNVDGIYKVGCRFWIPGPSADHLDRTTGTHYRMWERQGYITITEKATIDYELIFAEVLELAERLDFREIRVDPWSAKQFAERLKHERINVAYMHQGHLSMNEPTKYLEVLLDRRQIHHGNNPVLNMMAHNVVMTVHAHGNTKFDKEKSTGKIDGMVSLAMAIGSAMMDAGEYEGAISMT
jgi:phage terminase large subunit-like protein